MVDYKDCKGSQEKSEQANHFDGALRRFLVGNDKGHVVGIIQGAQPPQDILRMVAFKHRQTIASLKVLQSVRICDKCKYVLPKDAVSPDEACQCNNDTMEYGF